VSFSLVLAIQAIDALIKLISYEGSTLEEEEEEEES
jgi:hypothetical protein